MFACLWIHSEYITGVWKTLLNKALWEFRISTSFQCQSHWNENNNFTILANENCTSSTTLKLLFRGAWHVLWCTYQKYVRLIRLSNTTFTVFTLNSLPNQSIFYMPCSSFVIASQFRWDLTAWTVRTKNRIAVHFV